MEPKDFETLLFNPLISAKIINAYVSGAQSIQPRGMKLELVYMLLPCINNDEVREHLGKLKRTSNLSKLLVPQLEFFFSQINRKIKIYKPYSRKGLITACHYFELSIGDYIITANPEDYSGEKVLEMRALLKAAYNLGLILGKEQHLTVFRKLKITEL